MNLGPTEMLVIAAILVLLVVSPLVTIWALVDVANRPKEAVEHAGWSKTSLVLLILFTGFVGGLYYLWSVRPRAVEP